jgi:hypothetical protein
MGYIYMADVINQEGKRGVRIGRTGNLSSHGNDQLWHRFNLIDAWEVGDEVAAKGYLNPFQVDLICQF